MLIYWSRQIQDKVSFLTSMKQESLYLFVIYFVSLLIFGSEARLLLWTQVFFIQLFQRLVFLFPSPQNLIRPTPERPLGFVLINPLLKQLKQKKVICCQLKLPLMERLWHHIMAWMITYLFAIYFNSLYIHAICRPVCEGEFLFCHQFNRSSPMELPESP